MVQRVISHNHMSRTTQHSASTCNLVTTSIINVLKSGVMKECKNEERLKMSTCATQSLERR